MRVIHKTLFAVSTALIVSLPAAASAENWSICQAPNLMEKLGVDVVVAAASAISGLGDGATCEDAGADMASAQAKACEAAASSNNTSWGVLGGASDAVTPLTCG